MFNVNRKIPNQGSTIPVGIEACRVSTGMVGTRLEIFLLTLTTNDGFYLSSFRIKIRELLMYCFLICCSADGKNV